MITAAVFVAALIGLGSALQSTLPSASATNADELNRVISLPFREAGAPASPTLEAEMFALLNRSRMSAGIVPLAEENRLRSVARTHASDMFAFGYLSHRSRDGRLPLDRVLTTGVRFQWVGENLAYAPDVPVAHQLLMDSPGHRSNILSPVFHHVGIAVLNGGSRGVIVVEDFTD